MKKIFAAILIIALAFAAFAGGKKESGTDESLAKIKEKGVFTMGLDDSFPPMGFRDDSNQIVGYDIDLATEVAKRLGVKLAVQPIDWAAKEQELNTGKIDCIWNGFTMTAEREQALNFSTPYLDNAQVLVVRKDSGIKKPADLAGKTLGLQAGSSAADALDNSPDFKKSLKNVVEFKDNLTAFMDLNAKGLDAVLLDKVVAAYSISQTHNQFEILPESLGSEKYGIGFRKKDAALRNEVQRILEEMAKDGTIGTISTKWFGADISVIGK